MPTNSTDLSESVSRLRAVCERQVYGKSYADDLRAVLDALERLQEAEAQLNAAVASIADWCRGHNARGSDGPCDCSACRALADLPAAAREHLARDAAHEGHEVVREEPESVGLQQLGVYRLTCKTCAEREKALAEALRREANLRDALGVAKDLRRMLREPPDA